MHHLTPRQIVSELDRYIVGQQDAKRAVAVAIRNRWRRQQLPEPMRQDVSPKNIIMIGPTGVGKTEIATEEKSTVVGVLGQAGMEMDVEFQSMFEKMLPSKREVRRLSVGEARRVLFNQEADKLIDRDKIHRSAIERVEQSGIIFLDE